MRWPGSGPCARFDITVPIWRSTATSGWAAIRWSPPLCGEETEAASGDAIREAEGEEYAQADRRGAPVRPCARADRRRCATPGTVTVLASSAKADEVEHYLDLLDAREIVDAWTTSADVEETKPAPDLVHAALERSGAPTSSPAVMVGDTPWDIEAAQAAGVVDAGRRDRRLQRSGAARGRRLGRVSSRSPSSSRLEERPGDETPCVRARPGSPEPTPEPGSTHARITERKEDRHHRHRWRRAGGVDRAAHGGRAGRRHGRAAVARDAARSRP